MNRTQYGITKLKFVRILHVCECCRITNNLQLCHKLEWHCFMKSIATCLKSGHEVMCWVHSFQLLNNECVAESDNMAQTWTACLRIRQCTVNQTESLIVDWWQTVSNWKAECLKLKSCVYGRVTRLCGNTNGLQCFVIRQACLSSCHKVWGYVCTAYATSHA